MKSTAQGSSGPLLEAPMRRRLLAAFSQAVWPALALGRPFEADAADLRGQASGQPAAETLSVLRSRLELQFATALSPSMQAAARTWVRTSADAVARYFGRFPVPRVDLLIVAEDGRGILGAVTYDEPSLLIRIRLGRETTEIQFLEDQLLVHEMVQLAMPRIPRSQNWLREGVASYVEGVARCRVGLVAPATVWRRWAEEMPQGQPRAGDTGLDHAATWARARWGGAIFCLLADVELLRRSSQRQGLQQALQGVLAAGGHCGVSWSVDRILSTADASVGRTTLTDLYRRMKDSPEPVDLDGLWRSLGIAGIAPDEDAPLAKVRRAILS
ncbi:MAG: hypothetical protein KA439_09015 [Rhizobacter sp.]|nr:hypothetical protein [Rhizobacter sp.]MBP6269068.1 hypothetical protein [Rhizobacter sp.]